LSARSYSLRSRHKTRSLSTAESQTTPTPYHKCTITTNIINIISSSSTTTKPHKTCHEQLAQQLCRLAALCIYIGVSEFINGSYCNQHYGILGGHITIFFFIRTIRKALDVLPHEGHLPGAKLRPQPQHRRWPTLFAWRNIGCLICEYGDIADLDYGRTLCARFGVYDYFVPNLSGQV
jgi:hypothetical protein